MSLAWRRGSKYHLESDPPGFTIAAYYNNSQQTKDYILWRNDGPECRVALESKRVPIADIDKQTKALEKLKSIAEKA